jgi:hypothetical protein
MGEEFGLDFPGQGRSFFCFAEDWKRRSCRHRCVTRNRAKHPDLQPEIHRKLELNVLIPGRPGTARAALYDGTGRFWVPTDVRRRKE